MNVDIVQPLHIARAFQNLSQKDLAEKAGVTAPTISYIEAGKVMPLAGTKRKIEQVLGKVDWLRTFDEGVINYKSNQQN